MFGLATPAMAAQPRDAAPPLCREKKERPAQTNTRKTPKPEVCVRRYALM